MSIVGMEPFWTLRVYEHTSAGQKQYEAGGDQDAAGNLEPQTTLHIQSVAAWSRRHCEKILDCAGGSLGKDRSG